MQTTSPGKTEEIKQLLSGIAADQDKVNDLLREVAQVSHLPLRTVLQPILAARGKRLRPALVLLAAKQSHYDIDKLVLAAAAIELLHTATLIHDDMIDRATTRRGAATVNNVLSDRAAVLAGDYLFAKSSRLAAETGSVRVTELFAEVLMTIADGQLQEMFASTSPELLRDDYYKRIACKTASLFQASAAIGATLSQADEDATEALCQYGYNFGMAFQIIDDILDYVGDERELGKPVGSDLRQGIVTLPAIFLLHLFPDNNPIRLILEGDRHSEDDINRAVDMVRHSPAMEHSYAEAGLFIEKAKEWVAKLPNNQYRQVLIDLADSMMRRAS